MLHAPNPRWTFQCTAEQLPAHHVQACCRPVGPEETSLPGRGPAKDQRPRLQQSGEAKGYPPIEFGMPRTRLQSRTAGSRRRSGRELEGLFLGLPARSSPRGSSPTIALGPGGPRHGSASRFGWRTEPFVPARSSLFSTSRRVTRNRAKVGHSGRSARTGAARQTRRTSWVPTPSPF